MANTKPRTPISPFSTNLLSSLLILLATHPSNLSAQPQQPPTSSTPIPFNLSSPSSAIPSATDSAGYGSNDSTSDTTSPHTVLLNYYFLLLAVLVIAMLAIYWTLARRRRRAAKQLARMRQSVLAEDLRCWNRHQRDEVEEAAGRRRRRRGGEEGLDEGGEAPPAYVRVPDRALLMGEGKPPDYEERVGGGG